MAPLRDIASWLVLWGAALASCELAAEALKVEKITSGLSRPVGVAPASGSSAKLHVLVDSGEVLAIDVGRPGHSPEEIARVAIDDPDATVRGFLQLDDTRLLVGLGGDSRQSRSIALLNLAANGSQQADPSQLAKEVFPKGAADGPGAYVGLAKNEKRVFVALAAKGGRGGFLSAAHSRAGISDFRPLATARRLPKDFNPRALALSSAGYLVAICEVSSSAEAEPAQRLVFADTAPGRGASDSVWMNLDLPGVVALAESPRPQPTSRRLYALAQSPSTQAAGGLYRIDAAVDDEGRSAATATKLTDFAQPTAMAFDDAGALYVATALEATDSQDSGGTIWKVTGNL